ncbi:MAG: tetratricopeptide repeat protein [Brumimicrobium sp.]
MKIIHYFLLILSTSFLGFAQDSSQVKNYEKLYDQFHYSNPDKAFEYLNKIESLGRNTNDTSTIYDAYYLKGNHFLEINTDSSLYYYRYLFKIVDQGDIDNRINLNNSVGLAYQYSQKYDSALVYFNKCLSLAQNYEENDSYCAVLNNLGLTYYAIQNYSLSEEMFEKAYGCMLKHQSEEHLPNVINNLFSLYITNGKENIDSLIIKLKQYADVEDSKYQSVVYLNIGLFYYETNQLLKSERYLLEAKNLISDSISNDFARIMHSLGNLYVKNDQVSKGIQKLKYVQKNFPDYEEQYRLYGSFLNAYQAKGDIDSVIYFHDAILEFKDSIYALNINKTLAETQKGVEVIERNAEIENLKIEKALLKEKRQNQLLVLYASVVLFLILVIFLLVLFYKEKSKRKLQAELIDQKEKKVQEVLSTIKQKNKLIESIEKEKSELNDQQTLQAELQKDLALSIQEDWDIFSQYFKDQHQGFYKELKIISPDLTNNELRMCSLAKMRLSVKEIASILYLSVDAVKSGRYRIRKKLNVNGDVELSDFLNEM